jgi:hypothetical protein
MKQWYDKDAMIREFKHFFKVWCTLSKAHWDSGRYALDLDYCVFHLIDA